MEYDSASVKVMRSYDYCHFEIVLGRNDAGGLTEPVFNEHNVDEMRKEAARLVDKAVEQYKIKKNSLQGSFDIESDMDRLRDKYKVFSESKPKDCWTPEEKAIKKKLDDLIFEYKNNYYDYQDDWTESHISDEREDDETPW